MKVHIYELIRKYLQNLTDFIFYIIPRPTPSKSKIENTKLVAHRGWHDNVKIFENSMEGFELALKNNMWGIEFDIRWTKDGVPVVHHDPSCQRVWNKDSVIKDLTFIQLREEIPGIPTFEEVVTKFGKKIHFFIELKEEEFRNPIQQRKELERILSNLTPRDDFHIISVFTNPLDVFDIYDSKAYLLVAGITNTKEMSDLAIARDYDGVMGHFILCSDEILQKHKALEQKVGTGFPRSVNCLKREINRDVEWIFTNHPWNFLPFLSENKDEI